MFKTLWLLAGVVCLFALDRILKFWFLRNPSQELWEGFLFSLRFAKNYGIAFGVPVPEMLLWILIPVVLLVLVWQAISAQKNQRVFELISLSLIIAGAFSNFIDRLRYGYVIDYIDVSWFTVFNLSDAMITAGALLLLISLYFQKNEKQS